MKSPTIDKVSQELANLNPSHCQIRLLTSNVCPHICSFCHMEGDKRGSSFIDLDLFDSILTVLPYHQRNTITLVISGGEPLIHPYISYMTSQAALSGFHEVHMVTNGHKPKLLQSIAQNLDVIKIHLESYDPEFYQSIHGVSITHVLESLCLLTSDYSHKVVVEAPVNRLVDIPGLLSRNAEQNFITKLLEIKPEDGKIYPRFNSMVNAVMDLGYERVQDHDLNTFTYVKESAIVYVSGKCNSESNEDIFIDSSGYVYCTLGSGKAHKVLQAA